MLTRSIKKELYCQVHCISMSLSKFACSNCFTGDHGKPCKNCGKNVPHTVKSRGTCVPTTSDCGSRKYTDLCMWCLSEQCAQKPVFIANSSALVQAVLAIDGLVPPYTKTSLSAEPVRYETLPFAIMVRKLLLLWSEFDRLIIDRKLSVDDQQPYQKQIDDIRALLL
jgi:hypothetical protein